MKLFPLMPPNDAGKARKLGFINCTGDLVIDHQYAPSNWSVFNRHGFCVVNTPKSEQLLIIDQNNTTRLTLPNDHLISYMTPPDALGIFAVRHLLDKDDPGAYTSDYRERNYHGRVRNYAMNLQGEVVFEERISTGSNGFYQLIRPLKDSRYDLLGIINHLGEITVPPQFYSMGWSRSSPQVSVKKNELFGVIDYYGNEILPISDSLRINGEYIYSLEDNNILIYHTHSNKGRTISLDGEHLGLIPSTYRGNTNPKAPPSFSDGLIMITVNSKFRKSGTYFIDVYGKCPMRDSRNKPKMFPPEYWMRSFKEGRAAFRVNGLFGFIDKSGEVVIDAQYESASDFNNGLAKVFRTNEDYHAGRYCYINKIGQIAACNH